MDYKNNDRDSELESILKAFSVSSEIESKVYGIIEKYCQKPIIFIMFSDFRATNFVECGVKPQRELLMHLAMSLSVVTSTSQNFGEKFNEALKHICIVFENTLIITAPVNEDYFLAIQVDSEANREKALSFLHELLETIRKSI